MHSSKVFCTIREFKPHQILANSRYKEIRRRERHREKREHLELPVISSETSKNIYSIDGTELHFVDIISEL